MAPSAIEQRRAAKEEAAQAELGGYAAFSTKHPVTACAFDDCRLIPWIKGFLGACVAEFRQNSAASPLFHVKHSSRDGEPWTWPEIEFLEQAYETCLPVELVARILAREFNGTRTQASRMGLKPRHRGARR
jgi:hypothetical protein